MADIATLGIKIDSAGIVVAQKELVKFTNESKRTETVIDRLQVEVDRLKREYDRLIAPIGRAAEAIRKFTIATGAALLSFFNSAKQRIGEIIKEFGALFLAFASFQGLASINRTVSVFGQSISNLSAITGATGKDLEFYSEQALEIGRTTTLSASEAVEAFKLMASAKPDLLESAGALNATTREAVTLAEAAGITVPDAARALGNSLNQFRADASEAARFINVLAAGAQKGSSEIVDTVEALKNAGAAARSANISFEATNAAIQVLAQNGKVGAEAGTALRSIFGKLRLQTQELNPEFVGLSQAIENLSQRSLTHEQRVKVFGEEYAAVAEILTLNKDRLKELEEGLTGTNTAYDQAATNTDNLASDYKALSSAIEGLILTIFGGGEILRPFVQTLTSLVNGVTESLSGVADTVRTYVIPPLEYLVAVVGARMLTWLIAQAAQLAINAAGLAALGVRYVALTGLSGLLLNATILLTGAQTALTRAMTLFGGPVGLAVTALVLIAKAIYDATTAENAYDKSIRTATDALNTLKGARGQEIQSAIDAAKVVRDETKARLDSARAALAEAEALVAVRSARVQQTKGGLLTAGAVGQASREIEELKQKIPELEGVLKMLDEELNKAGKSLESFNETGSDGKDVIDDLGASVSTATDAIAEYERLISSLNQQYRPLVVAQEEYEKSLKILNARFPDATKRGNEYYEVLALINQQLADAQFEQYTAELGKYIDELEDADNESQALADSVRDIQEELSPAIRRQREYTERLDVLTDALQRGIISEREYQDLIGRLPSLYADAGTGAELLQTAVIESFKRLEASGASLWKSLLDGSGNALKSIKDLFINTLAELAHIAITRPIIVQFGQTLGGLFGGGGAGGFGGILSSFFGGGGAPAVAPESFVGPLRPGETPGGVPSVGSQALGGAGIGFGLGALNLFGGGRTGSTIGGALGGAGGSFLPFPGGNIVGSLIGSLLGGLFGGKKPRIRLGGENAPFTPDDPTDAVFMTALGIVKTELRKLSEQDLQNVIRAVTEFDKIIAQAVGDDRLPGLTEQLKAFYSTQKGKNVSIEENLRDRFDFIVQALGPEFVALIGKAGADIDAALERLQAVLAVDQLIKDTDILGDSLTGAFTIIESLAQGGESLSDTINRVVQQIYIFDNAIKRFGLTFEGSPEEVARTADELATLFGGIENLGNALSQFEQIIVGPQTDEERIAEAKAQIDEFNAALGLAGESAIDTREELLAYVRGLDLSTEAGRDAFKAAVELAQAVGIYDDALQAEALLREQLAEQARGIADALGELGNQFDLTNDAMVDAAHALAEVFGGVEGLTSAYARYLDIIGKGDEGLTADKALDQIKQFNDEFGLVGDSAVYTRDQLEEYVNGLDLTTEAGRDAFKAAIELAESIGLYEDSANQAIRSAMEIKEFLTLDPVADYARGFAESNKTLRQSLDESNQSVLDAIAGYDGSQQSLNILGSALRDSYQASLQFVEGIRAISDELGRTADLRKSIEEDQLTADQVYERRRAEIADLSQQLAQASSPEEVRDILAQINALSSEAYGLLSEEQRRILGPEFLSFLDFITAEAIRKQQEFEALVGGETDALQREVEGLDLPTAIQYQADRFAESSDKFAAAVESFVASQQNDTPESIGQRIGESIAASINSTSATIAEEAGQAIKTSVGNINVIVNVSALDEVNS